MADFTFKLSSNIMLGSYMSSRIGQFILECGNRVMFIVDPILKENGIADKIKQALSERQVDFFIFDEISEGAVTKSIEAALNLAKEAHIHSVLAVGGGKTMCVGRAVASVLNDIMSGKDFYTLVDGALPEKNPVPLICVPTSLRDAYIFTDRIPVIDSRSSKTKLMPARDGLCSVVVFDPNLNVTLSQNQTNSISIEILCLAIEAYLSQKANFFSDMLVEKSLGLMRGVMFGSENSFMAETQEEILSQAGCLASLAAGLSSVGTASLLSLCINSIYKIPRSLTSSILLPYVISDCAKFKLDRVSRISRMLGVAGDGDDDEQAANALAESVRQRIAQADLPARLKDLGVSIENLALVVENAAKLEFINFLPRSMNSDLLFELVKAAF